MDNEKPKKTRQAGAGRPFKMKIWVEKLKEVLDENNAIFLTDEDLVFLVNDKIDEEKCHITTRTLRNWKAGKAPDEATTMAFLKLFRRALIKQRNHLMEKMLETENNSWTKYAWILERRFAEWNLKHISEIKTTNEQKNIIQITASSEQQKMLIDNIINADFEVIEPIKLEAKNDNESEDYEF